MNIFVTNTKQKEAVKDLDNKRLVKMVLETAQILSTNLPSHLAPYKPTHASHIVLHRSTRGKYFRIVADIIYDGKSLSGYLLDNGLAVRYDGGTKPHVDWCQYE